MEGFEVKHGARDPLYETVVLFHDIVEMFDLKNLNDASGACPLQDHIDAFQTRQINPALVDNDPIRQAIGANCSLEKPPCRSLIAVFGEHKINGLPFIVDRGVVIGPLALELDVGLIHAAVGRLRAWAFAAIIGKNLTTHLFTIAWSTSMPRSSMISSRSR